jgi:hypothetical protein
VRNGLEVKNGPVVMIGPVVRNQRDVRSRPVTRKHRVARSHPAQKNPRRKARSVPRADRAESVDDLEVAVTNRANVTATRHRAENVANRHAASARNARRHEKSRFGRTPSMMK